MDPNSNGISEPGREDSVKRKQRIRDEFDSYKVNTTDCCGLSIKNIFARGDEYIVYQTVGDDLSLTFRTLIDPFDERDPKCLSKNYDRIEGYVTRFRSVLEKADNPLNCMQRASHGICLAIEGDIEGGKNIIEDIVKEINIDYKDRVIAKFLYLLGSICLISILTCLVTIVYFCRNTSFISHNMEYFNMLAAATFAGYGGFISVSLKLNDIKFDKEISVRHIMASAAQRMIYSLLFGVFTYILISSELLFGFAVKSKIPIYGILTICFVAGFSEKLVPNILSKLEAQKG